MQINITFRHLDSSEGLKEYVRKKIGRLEKYFEGPVEAQVILKAEKLRNEVEVILRGDGLDVTAKEETGDMYEAIDLVSDILEKQIKRFREKRKGINKKGRRSISIESSGELVQPEIQVERVSLKPMSVEEALEQFSKVERPVFLFINPDEGDKICALTREGERIILCIPE
ncbi:ribosome hibernation-promoting factor, HPF/YfiA family [Thermosulfurimonas dismutans]|uniref:Ribosome hibernation promoting factor n=1 Tax=Thermosulfurimonas dismutans TaxID=999894 RepID=A0A179D2G7_9BACT|nr:ribosome-associated translation inhibitor RaiA [Thermosulfurimonas dismutans]OAQ19899.1 Ribosome hibernation protein YhbH [Thermosulfurimonas dismutans]